MNTKPIIGQAVTAVSLPFADVYGAKVSTGIVESVSVRGGDWWARLELTRDGKRLGLFLEVPAERFSA